MPNAFVPFFEHMEAASQAAPADKNFVPMSAPAPVPAAPSSVPAHQPTIQVQREGDRIRQIRIQCSCGEVIELDCVY